MTEVTSVRVYIRHIRAARFCADGAREWFKGQGLSWNDFLENGLPAETLLATNDILAQRVVAIAEREANGIG